MFYEDDNIFNFKKYFSTIESIRDYKLNIILS